jgi:RNA polymerase sigma factor (sigma-70 family)
MTEVPLVQAEASDTQLQNLIALAASGEKSAREALLDHACDRLLRLTRKMFHGYPRLRRWEQTDDVFQNSLIRLHRALCDVMVESVRHFFNRAAVQVRRELLDLAKHHFGPHGLGTNHHTDSQPADDAGGSLHRQLDEPNDPGQWSEFHQHVEQLPDEEREVVNLLWYEGLTQDDAAKLLGVSLRTVKRRWHAARTRLHEALANDR